MQLSPLITLLLTSSIKYSSNEEQTIHNIDVVQRILDYFLMYEQQRLQQQELKSTTLNISKLVDSYLAEIARDPNVSITKFQVLAESLPRHARTCHDGLYRAIDTYLKVILLASATNYVALGFGFFNRNKVQCCLISSTDSSFTVWTWPTKAMQDYGWRKIVTWWMYARCTKWKVAFENCYPGKIYLHNEIHVC